METWGALLSRYRKERGMSVYALAKATGIAHPNLGAMEAGGRGVPRPESVRRVADGLGLRGEERAAFFEAVIAIVTQPYRDAAKQPAKVIRWVRVEEEVA